MVKPIAFTDEEMAGLLADAYEDFVLQYHCDDFTIIKRTSDGVNFEIATMADKHGNLHYDYARPTTEH